LNFANGDPDMN